MPERRSRSCPPPCSSGSQSTSRPSSSTPTPSGPPSLWAVMLAADSPLALKSTGSCAAACTASLCIGTSYSRATAARSAIGMIVPISLFAHMIVTSAVSSAWRSSSARSTSGRDDALLVDGQRRHLRALALGEPFHRVEHGVMLDGADQDPGAPRIGGPARAVDALDGEVVALGAAGNEDHLGRAGAEIGGDRLAGLLDAPTRGATGPVQGRRVADRAEDSRHRLDRSGQHRRGGCVIEVDRVCRDLGGRAGCRRHDHTRIGAARPGSVTRASASRRRAKLHPASEVTQFGRTRQPSARVGPPVRSARPGRGDRYRAVRGRRGRPARPPTGCAAGGGSTASMVSSPTKPGTVVGSPC